MGDFSRDPGARLQDAVARHYVGVRLQQGVPILDADWNELEDLRRHEVASVLQRFFGDGVPDGNDGFRVEALAGGGVGTLVLTAAAMGPDGASSVEIDFEQSPSASLLGFLPESGSTSRPASTLARLAGNAAEPFALADGMTFAVRANGEPAEVVTFDEGDFADIGAATAQEVADAINAAMGRVAAATGTGNDFRVRGGDGTLDGAGRMLVQGVEAVAEGGMGYASQPLYTNAVLAAAWGVPPVQALTTPGAARGDLVFLDVWDREVDAGEDDGFVVPAVGIEATVRLRREWAVRVLQGTTDLAGIPRPPGHRFAALAVLRRTAGQAAITAEMVEDARVRGLNVARYLKVPIWLSRGSDLLTAPEYADVLDALRDVLLQRLQGRVFPFSYADDYDAMLVLGAVRDLALQAGFGAVQARTGNFNNADGLAFLGEMYDLQTALLETVFDYGNQGSSSATFLTGYQDRLDGAPGIPGLRPALQAEDLMEAVEAQEAINAWLAAPIDALPEGSIVISIVSVLPAGPLQVNTPFSVTYRIRSEMSSPHAQEPITLVLGTASSSTWTRVLDRSELTLDALGGEGEVVATVTPRAGTASTVLRLTATSARNPAITQQHDSQVFAVNQAPPESFLQWANPPLDGQGRFPITQAGLSDQSQAFLVQLVNPTGTSRTCRLTHFVVPPAGPVVAAWGPDQEAPASSDVEVPANTTAEFFLTLNGPSSPPVGATGSISITAQVVAQGGVPVSGASQTLTIPFIITA